MLRYIRAERLSSVTKVTGLPTLKLLVKGITAFAHRNQQRIIDFGGEGLWSIVLLLIDIAGVLLAVMASNSNPNGDFLEEIDNLNSAQINNVLAAVEQFKAREGVA